MQTIRYRSRGEAVYILEELLVKLGYDVYVSRYFGVDTHNAVKDFQSKNNLVIDGIVGPKTWSKIITKEQSLQQFTDKFLAEQDLIDFGVTHNLELAVVKAVNQVESRGKGFFVGGEPAILFEGHVFWRQLVKRGIDPQTLVNADSKDVLYKSWTRKYYLGGHKEYSRMKKAARLSDSKVVVEAAYCSASWGAFQIMGYHYKNLGYTSIKEFVDKMYAHEREHLGAFGKFINANFYKGKNLTHWLRTKSWANFARAYNGPGYKQNKYDEKLEASYKKFNT